MQEASNSSQNDRNLEYLAYRKPSNWKLLRLMLDEQQEEFKASRMNIQASEESSESSNQEAVVAQKNEDKQTTTKKNPKKLQNPPESQKQKQQTISKDLSFNDSRSQEPNLPSANTSASTYSSRTRHCWPELSLYHRSCKVTLTHRQFYEFSADILVLPFRTLEFEYQPAFFLKQMLADQGAKLQKLAVGEISILTVQNLQNYRFAACLRVGKEIEKELTSGMRNLVRMIALNSKKNIRTVAFPVCEGLTFVEEMMRAVKNDENFEEIKELEIVYLFKKASLFKESCAKIMQNLKAGSSS